MHHRPLRRAAVLALVGLLAFAGVASADFVRADGDTITPGPQAFVDLGEVGPPWAHMHERRAVALEEYLGVEEFDARLQAVAARE